MNKQIEAIRNEINRLEAIHERNLKKPMERGRIGYAHGVIACCDRILSFIDSLPEEPNKSLEEAAEKYTDSSEWLIGENLEHIDAAFIAGAEWQAKQGYTKETTVYANRWTDVDEVTVSLGRGEYGFKAMDKVIVQIRKE